MHISSLVPLVPFFIAAVAADGYGQANSYGQTTEVKKGPQTFYIGPSGAVTEAQSHYGYLWYKGASNKTCSQLRININSTDGEYFNGIIPRGKRRTGGKCYWSKDKSIQLYMKKQNCTSKPPYKLMAGNVKEARARWKAKCKARREECKAKMQKCKSEGKDQKECCKTHKHCKGTGKRSKRFRRKFLTKRWKLQKEVKGSKKLTQDKGPYLTFNRRSCFYVCTCPQTQVKKVFGGCPYKKKHGKGKHHKHGKLHKLLHSHSHKHSHCNKKYEGCERISLQPREKGAVQLQWELTPAMTDTALPSSTQAAATDAPQASSTDTSQSTQGVNQAVATPSSTTQGPNGYGQ